MELYTCGDCQSFFQHQGDVGTSDYGICFADDVFEPYIDDILDNLDYSGCEELVDEKEFSSCKEVCDKFELMEKIEIDEDDNIGKFLTSCCKNNEKIDVEKLKHIALMDAFEKNDWAKASIDNYIERLNSSDAEERKNGISFLGFLISRQNENAFRALLSYFKRMSALKTIEDVHFRINLFNNLSRGEYNSELIPIVVDELYKISSNQTTRQWITALFKFLQVFEPDQIREPLEKMLESGHFSPKLKKKINDILDEVYQL